MYGLNIVDIILKKDSKNLLISFKLTSSLEYFLIIKLAYIIEIKIISVICSFEWFLI